jgi:hypothetical protein
LIYWFFVLPWPPDAATRLPSFAAANCLSRFNIAAACSLSTSSWPLLFYSWASSNDCILFNSNCMISHSMRLAYFDSGSIN